MISHKEAGEMRLHDFILTHRENILVEWQTFARSCVPAGNAMDVDSLRDHANEMLLAIAADLKTFQTEVERRQKSKGREPESVDPELTAAEKHGAGRAESGFTATQMVAEYRSLRASVIRLWTQECGAMTSTDVADLIRFNEAIDQLLAESIAEFTDSVESAKDMFLAILGHDLRNPLGAILLSATIMSKAGEMDQALTLRIVEHSKRATQMVGDLLDFTRSRLGGGIPVSRAEADLREIVRGVVAEVVAAHSDRNVQVEADREEIGCWDAARISQALINLVGNALEHSTPGTTATVKLGGGEEDVAVMIHNHGTAISANQLESIFNPMKRIATPKDSTSHGPTANLGLGLYIAERIVHAHGGRIEVESSEAQGTTFTVFLPRGC